MAKHQSKAVPIVLIICLAVIAFWVIMSHRSRNSFIPFELTAGDFTTFRPRSEQWRVVGSHDMTYDETIPILFTFLLENSDGQQITASLVYGYNMPECMKHKSYEVELLEDRRRRTEDGGRKTESGIINHQPSQPQARIQIWKLTSDIGDKSIWVTAMVRTGDYEGTDLDVRSMAFPRLASQDNPNWLPRGVTAESMKNPINNTQAYIRRKWSNARCDLATFLKLKKQALPAQDILTLVAHSPTLRAGQESEEKAIQQVLSALSFIHAELIALPEREDKRR